MSQGLAALLLALCLISPTHAGLRLLSEEFPPISFTEKGVARGMAVEIVQEIQRRQGGNLAIEFLPWARAFREAKGVGEVALFSMARTPEREKQFKWVGPIVTFYSSIYAPAKDGMRLRNLDDAKRAPAVLVVRDWFTAEELKTLGFQNLVSVSDPVIAIKMLLAKRAPFFASERLSMPDILAKAGIAEDSLEIVYSYASSEGYIAFSLDTPDATVKAWAERLREMKRDGSFLSIYKRWLPKDNPPLDK
ncbi:transporter substrate-binding domain-containing protein [Paucibacter sp. B2R-40]|uniref:substrate-binding periplasmic protein n=1 Tax=Paucibacter sp. B2R-40 TaxID=2893554 RepID=UPI0021E3E39F|nr:transporter substrate-binding domain-containing protein [Paucibacter sp. B2R-40]MCV2355928.1 transporter substrate-binding domain-containing protein [Paucibacter sp. B2R-40]